MTLIVEVEANGTLTLPPDVLINAKPHTRYVVETNGTQLTLRPEESEVTPQKKVRRSKTLSPEMWEEERQRLTEELSKVWPEGASVTGVISEMRR